MTDEISQEVFQHLVDLAALELDVTEAEYLRGQLNNQLRAIHEMAAIPLPEEIPPAAHGVAYGIENSQPPRADEWQPYPNSAAILEQAPQADNGYIIVPDIPHKALE